MYNVTCYLLNLKTMKKLQLKIKDLTNPTILSHHEIKNIMGGSEGGGGGVGCTYGTNCRLYIRELSQTYDGICKENNSNGKCDCEVVENGITYVTDPYTTSMCWQG